MVTGANRILLICDNGPVAMTLREKLIIEGGYTVTYESEVERGMSSFRQNGYDVVILKYGMPDSDTGQVIKEMKRSDPDCVVILLSEDNSPEILKVLPRLGAYDFVAKPINSDKLLFLIKKGIEMHVLMTTARKLSQGLQEQNTSLLKQNTLLAKRIEESTRNLTRLYEDLRTTYMRTIKVLAQAIDARDHYTHSHSENVAKYAVAIAQQMGLPVREIEIIREACELHDLGKIGVTDEILSKPSSLTAEEFEKIKRHPTTGAQILEPLAFLSEVVELVRQHHERYDGTGYPEGRRGEDIVRGARIINLSDSYDAMRSARSYRKIPLTKEQAIAEVRKNRGAQFDPKVVDAFLKIVDEVDPL